MKSLRRKVFISILTVMICFITLGTSTFAWFSMNNKVTVTGMTVSTHVDDNLFIASSTASTTKTADANFRNALHQEVVAKLQPVSSINGTSFFYTNNAAADGSRIDGDYTALADNDIVVNTVHYKGYADYVFELKAINTSASAAAYVNLTKLNLLYMGATTTTHAFRVAVFVQEQADPTATLAATEVASAYEAFGTADGIFAKSDYAYFTTGKAVSATTAATALANVSPAVNNAGISLTVGAGKTLYFKVTVRLWLEGEDTDCFNTKFVDLTDDWTLDLEFKLESANTNAVAAIGSIATGTLTNDANVLTAALSVTGETAATYEFHKIVSGVDTVVQADSATATYTMSAVGTYYCIITTAKGNRYMTNTIVKNS